MYDSRFAPVSLETGIARNRRRWARRTKYRAVCTRLCLKVFEYQDAGLEEKYLRVLAKVRAMYRANCD